MKRYTVTILGVLVAILLLTHITNAQQSLTLETAIEIALENNIGLKRAQNGVIMARNNQNQSKFEFLPSLNANTNYQWRGGFSGLNADGDPINGSSQVSFPSLNANFVLFNGLTNINTYSQNKLLHEAAQQNFQNQKDFTKVAVMGLYLQVLLAEENMKISQARLDLLNQQLTREEKRLEVGVSTQDQVFNFKSQIATENLNYITLKNNYDRFKLQLLQALLLESDGDYEIEPIEISDADASDPIEPYSALKQEAFNYSPLIKSSEFNLKATQKGLQIAKAGLYPTLTAGASVSSQFFSTSGTDYFQQLDDRRQNALGFGLNVPLFNRFRTINNIQNSKIALLNSELDLDQAKQTTSNNLQLAYQNLLAAQETFRAAQENLTALTQSFEFSVTRYNAGSTDFFSYLQNLNNKNAAEIQLVTAKYSIIFRKMILDIYKGL
ncbi:MAG: TolC family protein [Cyclobacteriaceae bacterium]